jgi:uncharacterized protein DUF5343
MADKHPYMSGAGGIVQAVSHLRKSFPPQVTAETLKKLGIAPNNETYVLNILRFVGVLDADFKKSANAANVFNQHDDADFQAGFAGLVAEAYSDLFGLHGDSAWSLPTDKLISYFRNTDHTSAIVGKRQASTFQALSGLSGKTETTSRVSTPKVRKVELAAEKAVPKKQTVPPPKTVEPADIARTGHVNPGMALTVRIEINLPAGGDKETYDQIFKSIRENLLNGNAT